MTWKEHFIQYLGGLPHRSCRSWWKPKSHYIQTWVDKSLRWSSPPAFLFIVTFLHRVFYIRFSSLQNHPIPTYTLFSLTVLPLFFGVAGLVGNWKDAAASWNPSISKFWLSPFILSLSHRSWLKHFIQIFAVILCTGRSRFSAVFAKNMFASAF